MNNRDLENEPFYVDFETLLDFDIDPVSVVDTYESKKILCLKPTEIRLLIVLKQSLVSSP